MPHLQVHQRPLAPHVCLKAQRSARHPLAQLQQHQVRPRARGGAPHRPLRTHHQQIKGRGPRAVCSAAVEHRQHSALSVSCSSCAGQGTVVTASRAALALACWPSAPTGAKGPSSHGSTCTPTKLGWLLGATTAAMQSPGCVTSTGRGPTFNLGAQQPLKVGCAKHNTAWLMMARA